MLLILLAIFILIAVLLFIQKIIFKRRLESGLGRKVADRELTSISSWMEASDGGDEVERTNRSAGK